MQTKIKTLLGAAFSLLVTFGFTQRTAAQERMVFYAPVVATIVSQKTHTVSYQTNNQIFSMNVDGTNVRQLTTGTENCHFPSWRPGRTHILFFRESDLYIMNADGSGAFAVATGTPRAVCGFVASLGRGVQPRIPPRWAKTRCASLARLAVAGADAAREARRRSRHWRRVAGCTAGDRVSGQGVHVDRS